MPGAFICFNAAKFAFPPLLIAADPDAYGGFRIRTTDPGALENASNALMCSACRLVDDGKRIVCKGKQPNPGELWPRVCEFERIDDLPFGEPGVFPTTGNDAGVGRPDTRVDTGPTT